MDFWLCLQVPLPPQLILSSPTEQVNFARLSFPDAAILVCFAQNRYGNVILLDVLWFVALNPLVTCIMNFRFIILKNCYSILFYVR